MPKFRFIGDNAQGLVSFQSEKGELVFRKGVAVEVEDERLAGKLRGNGEFVEGDGPLPKAKPAAKKSSKKGAKAA